MKAIILVGGHGTRLRPLTYSIPKAMIPINGQTLTEHVFDILKKYDITEILLSVSYKKEMMKDYFKDGKSCDIDIKYIEEPEPLGTAGPLIILNKEHKPLKETFFMINGDNLFDLDLDEMIGFHRKNKAAVTIALSKVKDARHYGVAILKGDKITEFMEKPENPPSNYINSGYYLMEPVVFNLLKEKDKAMLEKDLFPKLAKEGKLFGYKSNELWFDTGTHERYEEVKKKWKLS